jgi:hypothetical protein
MIGASEERTQRLLLEVGARHSLKKGSTKWVLITRVPFPDDPEAEPEEADQPRSD